MKWWLGLGVGLLAVVLLLALLPILLWSPWGGFEGIYVRPGEDDSLWRHWTEGAEFNCGRLLDEQIYDVWLHEDGTRVRAEPITTVSRTERIWVVAEQGDQGGQITLELREGRLHIDTARGHKKSADKVHNPVTLWYLMFCLWTRDE